MRTNNLANEYFNWMYNLVCDDKYSKQLSYRKLFERLHKIEFTYILEMDENRAMDGIDFRYHFAYENGYDYREVASQLDIGPCSVLEMMVALSRRCENIMEDPEYGDRTGQWFWDMIVSLGLDSMNDKNYDENYVDNVIDTFLYREYDSDGRGGLFTIPYCKEDLRDYEIWYQMNWYLNEF